jgi:hypothetical protein
MSSDPFTRTFGHGSIKLTAYPSSGRVGVETSGTNPVMDWWELEDFLGEMKSAK